MPKVKVLSIKEAHQDADDIQGLILSTDQGQIKISYDDFFKICRAAGIDASTPV
jgi:hypothetical protein